jgi:GMP synthase (glutamine-hydrolysing)
MYYFTSLMDTIAILDFGGQYTHLIANRIRRLGVYSTIVDNHIHAPECREFKGIILSGGPNSVLDAKRPAFDTTLLTLPMLLRSSTYGPEFGRKSFTRNAKGIRHRAYDSP